MTFGGSIALLLIGAILYFAVEAQLAGINLDVVGIILMIAGALGFILSLLFLGESAPLRRRVVTYDDHDHFV